ncbi:response regulator transcription factor [Intrasporangium sp. DVR]|uniref:response regulator transcription factor n=1 Tax=Intrasporangium sp. DVR TaxID=3127867 RepID=UPI00333E7A3F
MPRVLVIDDDSTVAEVVAAYLERAGMDVDVAGDGPAGLGLARDHRPDVVLLDLMLPGPDGLEVCRQLRLLRPGLPVIMVTARGEEPDRVLGLQIGADDYVTKPFSPRELVLRVQSLLRRVEHAAGLPGSRVVAPAEVVDGDLVVDRAGHRVRLAGRELTLTTREFDLLSWLVSHPGQVFTRAELMSAVWGWEFGDESTVTVHVRRVREKVEADPARPRRLVTVFGVGYRWDAGAGDDG